MTEADPPDSPVGSIVIPFRHGGVDGPVAVVIGSNHMPFYRFRDGRTAPASPEAAETQA